jgi:hypothetical protein
LEWAQVAEDLLRLLLDAVKRSFQRIEYLTGVLKAAIVGSVNPRVVPEGLSRIEIWRIGWQTVIHKVQTHSVHSNSNSIKSCHTLLIMS